MAENVGRTLVCSVLFLDTDHAKLFRHEGARKDKPVREHDV